MDAPSAYDRLSELQVLDVRDPVELESGMIEGAINVPLHELAYRMSELDWSRPILTVCETGERSSEAASILSSSGFDAHSLDGGMWGWHLRRLPVVAP